MINGIVGKPALLKLVCVVCERENKAKLKRND